MSRAAREKSKTGIYHIILRGTNSQNIFEEEEDCVKFLDTLSDFSQKSKFEIYAYCLMNNHIHLLLKEGTEDFGMVFRRIGASFVYWYNWKYKRSGHLFQDRYKSETVEDEKYFLTVLRYIHQNPVKAGITNDVAKYKWSSYDEYIENQKICNTDYALKMFSEVPIKAIDGFRQFMNESSEDKCLDVEAEHFRLTDEEAKELMIKVCKTANASEFQKLETSLRDRYLKELIDQGISIRQLARITGIGRSIIMRNV